MLPTHRTRHPVAIFHPRCRYAQARCSEEDPELRVVNHETGHEASCHFAEELDLQGIVATDGD